MFRKKLLSLLLDKPKSVSQIAREVREHPKDVADDLEHLLKSLKHTEFEAVVTPAQCKKCEFVFDSDKLTKPSKCPECHSTWLSEALIAIREQPADPV
jgi:predicted Zn-ribbon and HTH transcriptional regulator